MQAVKAALDEGILPGGGVALRDIYYKHYLAKGKPYNQNNDPEVIAYEIILNSLQEPFNMIRQNAAIKLIYPTIKALMDGEVEPAGIGTNVKTGEKGNMIEMGIIDPLKVTKEALLNAVAVSKTILSTNAIVTMARTYESKN